MSSYIFWWDTAIQLSPLMASLSQLIAHLPLPRQQCGHGRVSRFVRLLANYLCTQRLIEAILEEAHVQHLPVGDIDSHVAEVTSYRHAVNVVLVRRKSPYRPRFDVSLGLARHESFDSHARNRCHAYPGPGRVGEEIGRAHVCTPVTRSYRMTSSA